MRNAREIAAEILDEQAERCVQLSQQTRSLKVARMMRLLAVDLMFAAQSQRAGRSTKPGRDDRLLEAAE